MDQFGQGGSDDLQRAIDEISNNSAAPETTGDDINLGEAPTPPMSGDGVPPMPEMMENPILGVGPGAMASDDAASVAESEPVPAEPAMPDAPADSPVMPDAPAPAPVDAPASFDAPAMPELAMPDPIDEAEKAKVSASATAETAGVETTPEIQPTMEENKIMSDDLVAVKNSALLELVPVIDTLNLDPEKKYGLIVKVIDSSKDKTIVPKALEAAKEIADPRAKAEALLRLVQLIDTL